MSCYHPLIGLPIGKNESGKDKYLIRKAINSRDPLYEAKINNGVVIPCGKCIGCRLDYSRRWADRMMLELETAKKGLFVTLTYDNEHAHWCKFDENGLPLYNTLDKRDAQLFMKSLRRHFPEKRIRFFMAGEYGEKSLRSHLHAILFGIGLDDLDDLQPHGRNELGQNYFLSPQIQERWKLGFVLVADVSWETCAYVARYVVKKQNGKNAEIYKERNCIPEFCLMSRRPGIGYDYLKEHPDCLNLSSINISTPKGGVKINIPKYYIKKIECTDEEKYGKIMEQRKRFASDRNLLELQGTSKKYNIYLKDKEEEHISRTRILKRKGVM